MKQKIIIGVLGPGENASPEACELAYQLGRSIAKEGWIVLTGGREYGTMDAAMRGATEEGGLTIGVLPLTNSHNSSPFATIRIVTGLGSARNSINVLSSHVVLICGMSAGTASEVAVAIKSNKKVILVNQDEQTVAFFRKIGPQRIITTKTVEETMAIVRDYVAMNQIA